MTTQTLTVVVLDSEWWTSNARLHWRQRAKRTASVREAAGWAARQHLDPVNGPVAVTATITYPRRGTADPANASPMVKAILDGLTDAGIWPDDDSRHVTAVTFQRDNGTCRAGTHLVTIEIREVS